MLRVTTVAIVTVKIFKEVLLDESKKSSYSCRRFRTRFLPATKALAKEMPPIIDKTNDPIYIIEEAKNLGIEDISVVT